MYGFDTGSIAHARGWGELRADDCGVLWEQPILKQQREVDFVLPRGRDGCDAVECTWSAAAFDTRGVRAFRAAHPRGRDLVVVPQTGDPYRRRVDGVEVTFGNASDLRRLLGNVTM